jgi:hypothetical protein
MTLAMNEKHYSVKELAAKWGFSVGTIRNQFKNDPDVLRLQGPGSFSGKRSYTTIKIPESIAVRLYQRLISPPLKVTNSVPLRNPRRIVFLGDRLKSMV